MAKRNTRVAGHTLRYEGAPFDADARRILGPRGRAKCSCGGLSDVLPSGSARRRWHAEHKTSVAERGA